MTKRMVLYELGKVIILLAELTCVLFIAYSFLMLAWFGIQYLLSAIQAEDVASITDSLPDRAAFAAKYIRFFYTGMTEKEAHAYIEQRAMESRSSKRSIAENIIKSYE